MIPIELHHSPSTQYLSKKSHSRGTKTLLAQTYAPNHSRVDGKSIHRIATNIAPKQAANERMNEQERDKTTLYSKVDFRPKESKHYGLLYTNHPATADDYRTIQRVKKRNDYPNDRHDGGKSGFQSHESTTQVT